jgi:phospho-N-acetylmuramoyl-pentapeptide-transferase
MIDDLINIKGLGGKVAGLSAPLKLAMITMVGAIGAWWFYFKLDFDVLQIPFYDSISLGLLIIPVFIFIVIATSNAVNMTDGLDGLAGGLLINAFGAFGIITAMQGNYGISAFCFSVVGALLAYTWFNIAPARFIMGDVGSFALGTALGVVAMQSNTLLLLPVIGFIFVLEAGSVLMQVLSKKFLKRKLFRAAPLHHHLEAGGWPKTKVTMRFWILSQICALFGVTLAIVGGFIS